MAHAAIAFAKAQRAAPHDGLHDVDRPRRHEHGHGGRRRPRQPPARPAPPRRRLRQPRSRTRSSSRSRTSAIPTISANDCFRPVSRYWDRITRPEQLLQSLPAAHRGPHGSGRLRPRDAGPAPGRPGGGLRLPRALLRAARPPAPPAGTRSGRARRGGRPAPARASGRCSSPAAASTTPWPRRRSGAFAERHGIPVAETQAGKGALPWDHPACVGAIGVMRLDARPTRSRPRPTSSSPSGPASADFTTGSRALFQAPGPRPWWR